MHQTSSPSKAEELGVESSHLLKKDCPPSKPNITLEELKAIMELKEDQSQVVLTADKGVAMVVKDREDYMDKAQSLLVDTNTYKTVTKDPTNKLKNKLFPNTQVHQKPRRTQWPHLQKSVPTRVVPPKFMAFPK